MTEAIDSPISAAEVQVATTQPVLTPDVNTSTTVTRTTRTLRVWVPPSLLVAVPPDDTAVLQSQINNFAAAQSDLTIILEPKAVSGQGGILSYLRTGRNIAPSIMPDLIALPSEQIASVFDDGLIVSLDTLIDPTSIDQLYPSAQTYAYANEQIAGYPFVVNQLTHFAYNNQSLADPFPANWDDLIAIEDGNLGIPMGGRNGGVLLLQLYLAAGGSLTNDAEQTSLQTEPLIQVLDLIQNSTENDFLDITVSQGSSVQEMWDAYRLNRIAIILTTAEGYLQQPEITNTAVTPISGINANLTPLVTGWSWAITAPDATQQALASDLLNYLTDPIILGGWSAQSNMLPANPNAFEQWSVDDEYLLFIQSQLTVAEAIPPNASLELITLLQEAARSVITGSATPQAAAETAVAKLQE